MRYEVERHNGEKHIIEADHLEQQAVGGSGLFLSAGVSAIHYAFRNKPKEQYGAWKYIAVFTDVRVIRLLPETSGEPQVIDSVERQAIN